MFIPSNSATEYFIPYSEIVGSNLRFKVEYPEVSVISPGKQILR
jgi:hypothetical protein